MYNNKFIEDLINESTISVENSRETRALLEKEKEALQKKIGELQEKYNSICIELYGLGASSIEEPKNWSDLRGTIRHNWSGYILYLNYEYRYSRERSCNLYNVKNKYGYTIGRGIELEDAIDSILRDGIIVDPDVKDTLESKCKHVVKLRNGMCKVTRF